MAESRKGKGADRGKRLAAALKANLRRRKEQTQARAQPEGEAAAAGQKPGNGGGRAPQLRHK